MPASSPTEICNAALIKVGADTIISLSDDNQRTRIVNERYNAARRKLLRSHPWNWATKRVELAALATDPEYEFTYQFNLPSDCLRVLATDLIDGEEWRIESNRVLLCYSSSVKIKYISDITDTMQMDDCFVEALACHLASDIAYSITQSNTLAEALKRDAEIATGLARSFDAQEAYGDKLIADEWFNSRF